MSLSATKIKELSQTYSQFLKYEHGDLNISAKRASDPEMAGVDSLVFVSTENQLQSALKSGAKIFVYSTKLAGSPLVKDAPVAFSSPAVTAAMTILLPFFDDKKTRFTAEIHPTAVVHPSAQIGKNVGLGPYAVVGENCVIGEGTLVGAHTVIEKGAKVGAHCILHPQVFIGANCVLGNRCEIHPHTTIGSDGFGYVQGPDKKRHKIPQIGIVVIEDDVEIGANCAIDRSTLAETRIGRGCKFDNFCHVAHNVVLGSDSVFAAGFKVAGSTKVGSNVTTGGGAEIGDHLEVASDVTLAGRSGVIADVKEPGIYAGFPLEKYKDGVRTLSSLPYLSSMRKQLAQIRKHLGLNEE